MSKPIAHNMLCFVTVVSVMLLALALIMWINPQNREWEGSYFYIDYLLAGFFVEGGILFALITLIKKEHIVEKVIIIGSILLIILMVGAVFISAVRTEYPWVVHEYSLQWPGASFGLLFGFMRRNSSTPSNFNFLLTRRLLALIIDLAFPVFVQLVFSMVGLLLFQSISMAFFLIGTFASFFLFLILRSRSSGSLGEKIRKIRILNVSDGNLASAGKRFFRAVFIILWPIDLLLFLAGSERSIGDLVSGIKVEF